MVGRIVDAYADAAGLHPRVHLVPVRGADLAQVWHGAVGVDVDQGHAVQAGEGSPVRAPQAAAGGRRLLEVRELGEADGGVDAGHLVPQPEALHAVAGGLGAFGLGLDDAEHPHPADRGGLRVAARDHNAALPAGEVLDRPEAEARQVSGGADAAGAVAGAEGVCGVLHGGDVPGGQLRADAG